ncbi:unnamed protein product [Effrenium voratum]|nr:unnamed protein product [Effrenium voratum]
MRAVLVFVGILRLAAAEPGSCSADGCQDLAAKKPRGRGGAFIQAKVHKAKVLHHAEPDVKVVSYNLYWWHVKKHDDWAGIQQRLKEQWPFDLVGFQECEDVASMVAKSGMQGMDFYQGPNKPDYNPAPIAWRKGLFQVLGHPGFEEIGSDIWGIRILTYVRLQLLQSKRTVLFANTHGPLGDCEEDQGKAWVKALEGKRQRGDAVFLTGDFNCREETPAMRLLTGYLANGIKDVIDHVLTDTTVRAHEGGRVEGYPSDHPLVWGSFFL